MNDLHAELSALVKSPGWLWVMHEARKELDETLTQQMTLAANDRDDAMALQKIRQVVAARKAIERLLASPSEKIRRLEESVAREHEPVGLGRRGPL